MKRSKDNDNTISPIILDDDINARNLLLSSQQSQQQQQQLQALHPPTLHHHPASMQLPPIPSAAGVSQQPRSSPLAGAGGASLPHHLSSLAGGRGGIGGSVGAGATNEQQLYSNIYGKELGLMRKMINMEDELNHSLKFNHLLPPAVAAAAAAAAAASNGGGPASVAMPQQPLPPGVAQGAASGSNLAMRNYHSNFANMMAHENDMKFLSNMTGGAGGGAGGAGGFHHSKFSNAGGVGSTQQPGTPNNHNYSPNFPDSNREMTGMNAGESAQIKTEGLLKPCYDAYNNSAAHQPHPAPGNQIHHHPMTSELNYMNKKDVPPFLLANGGGAGGFHHPHSYMPPSQHPHHPLHHNHLHQPLHSHHGHHHLHAGGASGAGSFFNPQHSFIPNSDSPFDNSGNNFSNPNKMSDLAVKNENGPDSHLLRSPLNERGGLKTPSDIGFNKSGGGGMSTTTTTTTTNCKSSNNNLNNTIILNNNNIKTEPNNLLNYNESNELLIGGGGAGGLHHNQHHSQQRSCGGNHNGGGDGGAEEEENTERDDLLDAANAAATEHDGMENGELGGGGGAGVKLHALGNRLSAASAVVTSSASSILSNSNILNNNNNNNNNLNNNSQNDRFTIL